MKKLNKRILIAVTTLIFMCSAFVLSNPNCPTGYSTAPSLNGTTVRNCTSCHSGTVNPAGGSVTAIGLPTTFTAGQSYPFSIKITHSAANRLIWGVSIKAIDTLTHAVIGTWVTQNTNTSIKGTPTIANGNYELSHANAPTSTASATYTYSNLTWVAPAVPTAVQSRVKFYIAAVAGNNSGDETGDFVYTTSLTSNQYVAPPACTFTYGSWTTCNGTTQTRTYTTSPAGCTGTPPTDSITRACSLPCTFTYGSWTTCNGTTQTRTYTTSPANCTGTPPTDSITRACSLPCTFTYGIWTSCSNGTQRRTYTTSPANCTGTPPSDSITRTCVMPTGLPTPVTITTSIQPQTCDTIRTFTVANQSGVYYAWVLGGAGNIITNGQGTNTISTIVKSSGGATVSLSNSIGSIPATSLAFARAAPPTPTAINGTITPCVGAVVTYTLTNPIPTIAQVPAIKFRWTKPAFTTIISANADSSSINLSFDAGYNGGGLSAKGESACGNFGAAKGISFSPAKVITFISNTGFYNACIGSSVNFIVISPAASVILPITVFRWTIPASTTIISANMDSSVITLQFNAGFRGGVLKVQSSTTCGALGVAVSKTLTHLNCAVGQRGASNEYLTIDQVNLYPNPNNGTFSLNVESSSQKNSIVEIQIFDMYSRLVGNYTTQSYLGVFSKTITNSNLQNGIYFVTYIIGNTRKTIRMLVQK